MKRGEGHVGKNHWWVVVVWDLVAASYSHEDSGIDRFGGRDKYFEFLDLTISLGKKW